jgi:hypothetical protein
MMGEVSWDPKRSIQSFLWSIAISFAMFFVLKIFKTELHEVSPRGMTVIAILKQLHVLFQHPPTQINMRAVLNQGQKNKYNRCKKPKKQNISTVPVTGSSSKQVDPKIQRQIAEVKKE